jgi:hypothetical protein
VGQTQSDFKKRFPPIADALAAGERWLNAFFAQQGLFSLKHAYEAPSASKVTCHRKSYTSNHRGEAVPDSPRMQAGHQRPREHRMKLDGFGKIPFLHRRVDCPLNTMIP